MECLDDNEGKPQDQGQGQGKGYTSQRHLNLNNSLTILTKLLLNNGTVIAYQNSLSFRNFVRRPSFGIFNSRIDNKQSVEYPGYFSSTFAKIGGEVVR